MIALNGAFLLNISLYPLDNYFGVELFVVVAVTGKQFIANAKGNIARNHSIVSSPIIFTLLLPLIVNFFFISFVSRVKSISSLGLSSR